MILLTQCPQCQAKVYTNVVGRWACPKCGHSYFVMKHFVTIVDYNETNLHEYLKKLRRSNGGFRRNKKVRKKGK